MCKGRSISSDVELRTLLGRGRSTPPPIEARFLVCVEAPLGPQHSQDVFHDFSSRLPSDRYVTKKRTEAEGAGEHIERWMCETCDQLDLQRIDEQYNATSS